jgi:tuberous sclerosis protein 2
MCEFCRLGSAEWLLSGGLSMTWLLGHKLVTVTTSGCSQKAIRGGLCDKCLTTCRLTHDKVPTTTAPVSPIQQQSAEPELELTPSRRRHKSAIQHSVSGEVCMA